MGVTPGNTLLGCVYDWGHGLFDWGRCWEEACQGRCGACWQGEAPVIYRLLIMRINITKE